MTCHTCHRTMRPRRTSLADYPGTIAPASSTECSTCKTRRFRPPAVPRAVMAAGRVAAVVEDAEFLVGWCVHPEDAARRLGYKTPQSLMTTLTRAGRPDIAARFARIAEVA